MQRCRLALVDVGVAVPQNLRGFDLHDGFESRAVCCKVIVGLGIELCIVGRQLTLIQFKCLGPRFLRGKVFLWHELCWFFRNQKDTDQIGRSAAEQRVGLASDIASN